MLHAVTTFLTVLANLANARQGPDDDVTRFFKIGAALVDKGAKAKDALEAATVKMQQLVDEKRSMTQEEMDVLDQSIRDKLERAAAVDLRDPADLGDGDGPTGGPTPSP